MRCKICDYRLWNLRSRVCPECGTAFKPSEFEFFLNSVQFCCLHCNQAYYGTGPKGHLVPSEFECVKCARQVHMDEMVLLPTEGIEEEQTKADTMPWMERKKRGGVRAWLSTVRMALVSPGRLMNTVPLDSPAASALWFAIFSNVIIFLPTLLSVVIFALLIALLMPNFAGPAGGPAGGPPIAVAIMASLSGLMFVIYVGMTLSMIVGGLVAHGLLKVTGKTAGTLGRTYQAIGYSSGANVISAFPCLGVYFGWLWWLISAIIMLKHGQKVHGGRATLAVGFTPFLLIGAFIGLMVWSVSAARTTMAGANAQIIAQALLDFTLDNDGRAPDHAIELVAQDYLASFDLLDLSTATVEKDVPLATGTLEGFDDLSDEEQDTLVQAVIDQMPDGVIAHRLGDYVFTYHGIDMNLPDPGLWLIIVSPDPDANSAVTATSGGPTVTVRGTGVTTVSSSGGLMAVGLADGSVLQFPSNSLPSNLLQQNALRAKYNVPPLPDPATVTHAKPAVAPAQPATDPATDESGQVQEEPASPDDES